VTVPEPATAKPLMIKGKILEKSDRKFKKNKPPDTGLHVKKKTGVQGFCGNPVRTRWFKYDRDKL
jgi:hypothetical protein